jgi:hypothetical protein
VKDVLLEAVVIMYQIQLSCHRCSPSMASFGSGFNDYVNGLRPPRTSLDGRKLTSVRGPDSSCAVASATNGKLAAGSSQTSLCRQAVDTVAGVVAQR